MLRELFLKKENYFLHGGSVEFIQGWIFGKYNIYVSDEDVNKERQYWLNCIDELDAKLRG